MNQDQVKTLHVNLRADFARMVYGYQGSARYCRVPIDVDLSELTEDEIEVMESVGWTASNGDDLTEVRIVDRLTRAERCNMTPEQREMYGTLADTHDALVYSWPALGAERIYSDTEKDPDTGSSLILGARLTQTGAEYVKQVVAHMNRIGNIQLRETA